jgi:hypothetical protein
MWHGDASTSATVGWASRSSSSPGKLHYDTVDRGGEPSKYRYSQSVSAKNTSFGMNNAFVRLSGLQPATAYYFIVADSSGTSSRLWFRTAPSGTSERLSVIVGGDSRNNRTPRKAANSLVAKIRPDAVVFGGDMTGSGTDSEWNDWMNDWQLTIASDGRIAPVMIARGNHEESNDILVKLFDTPSNVYYATGLGKLLRVYTLNSEISVSGTQTDWLKSDLSANADAVWKIAQYHRPMRPHNSSKSDSDTRYSAWAPVFHQHGVDIVSENDAHTVKQTWPIRPYTGSGSSNKFIRDDRTGTVYIGEGCWGAPLRSNDKNRAWTRNSGKFNQFFWLLVDSREIEMRVVQVDNASGVSALTESDRFTLPRGIKIWNPSNGDVVKLAR